MNRGQQRTAQSLANRRIEAKRPLRVPGLNINVIPNPYAKGLFQVVTLTVQRQRQGKVVEIKKKALVNGALQPVTFGSNKWLTKQLKKYEYGYALWLMTRDTEAEGM